MTITDFDWALITAVAVLVLFQVMTWSRSRAPVSIVQPTPALNLDLSEPVKKRMDGMASQLSAHDAWLKQIDHDLKGVRTGMQALPSKNELPSKDLVHRMEVQMAEMRGQIGTIEATSNATARQVERIADHLLSKD